MSSKRAFNLMTLAMILFGIVAVLSTGIHVYRHDVLYPGAVVNIVALAGVLALNLLLVWRLHQQGALEQNIQRQSQVIDSLTEAVVQFDAQQTVTGWNAAAERMYGVPAEEAIGKPVGRVIQIDDVIGTTSEQALQQLVETGHWRGAAVHRFADGRRMDVMVAVQAINDGRRNPHYVASVLDVTEQRTAEQSLHHRETQLNAVVQNAPVILLAVDTDCRLTVARGQNLAHLLGEANAEPYIGKPLDDVIPTLGLHLSKHCRHILQGEAIAHATLSTHSHIFEVYFSPIYDKVGAVVGVTIAALDITERRQTDAALQRYAIRLETLRQIDRAILALAEPEAIAKRTLEYLPFLIPHVTASLMIFDDDGDIAQVLAFRNPAQDKVEITSGYTLSRADVRMPPGNEAYAMFDLRAIKRTPLEALSYAAGAQHLVIASLRHTGVAVGRLSLGVASLADIETDHWEIIEEICNTLAIAIEQARLNAKVREHASNLEQDMVTLLNEEHLAQNRSLAVLQNSLDAIALTDAQGMILQTNPAFYAMFAYDDHATMPQSITELIHSSYIGEFKGMLAHVMEERQPMRLEMEMCRHDSDIFTAAVAIAPITDIYSSMDGLVLNLRDITQTTQNRLELQRALQRERNLGELRSRFISTVSHEFRTPLTIIGSSLDLIEMYLGNDPPGKSPLHIERIRAAVNTMSGMLDEMTILQKADSQDDSVMNPIEFAPTNAIETAVSAIEAANPASNINMHLPPAQQTITADYNLFVQIVRNLVMNAVTYAPTDSPVDVRATFTAQYFILRVVDRGIGIPQRDLPHLFEPFFRASNVSSTPGTGLGLSIVKRAVDLHRGTLNVESVEAEGTTFIVQLPIVYQLEDEGQP